MKIFLTGASGFIGSKLAFHLAENGNEINALVRSISKAKAQVDHPNIKFYEGALSDDSVFQESNEGLRSSVLLAAYAQVWNKDPNKFFDVNVKDNLNLIKECHQQGIKKIVLTSTAGVFGPSKKDEEISENSIRWTELTTDYEKSKLEAETQIKDYVSSSGNHIVIVNPSRVYGPGKLSPSNSVTRMIKEFYEGTWHVIQVTGIHKEIMCM